MFFSSHKRVGGAMALTQTGTKKYHKVSEAYHKVSEAKYRSNPYKGDSVKKVLPII